MDVDIKSFNHPKELSIAPSKWYRELADAENAPLIEPIETYGIAGRIWSVCTLLALKARTRQSLIILMNIQKQ